MPTLLFPVRYGVEPCALLGAYLSIFDGTVVTLLSTHSMILRLVFNTEVNMRAVPLCCISVFLVSVPELVWTSDEYKEMGALDKVGKPGGLGWPGTMRLSTGSQLLGTDMPYIIWDASTVGVEPMWDRGQFYMIPGGICYVYGTIKSDVVIPGMWDALVVRCTSTKRFC